MMRLPKKIEIGGHDIDILVVDSIEGDHLGQCSLPEGYIKIAETSYGKEQSISSQNNTLYHEITHLILDTMGEFDLSKDEKFVSTFSSFLTSILKSFKYD